MAGSTLKKSAVMPLLTVLLMLCIQLLVLIPGAAGAPGVVDTITVGDNPWSVGVNPITNTVYVSNWYDDSVSVIDGATNTVTTTVGVGPDAAGVAVNPATNMVYVVSNGDGDLYVIDGATNTVNTTVDLGSNALRVSVNPATNTIYVANRSSNDVYVIDGATNTLTTTISMTDPYCIDINPTTNLAYVTNSSANTVSVIDCATNTVTGIVSLTGGSGPGGICVNPTTNMAYVANWTTNNVSVIDCATNTMTGIVEVGSWPADICVNASTNMVYTANNGSANVSIIDGSTGMVTDSVAAGSGPDGITANPVTGRVYVANAGSDSVSVIADPDIVPFSDEFTDTTLDPSWTWTDPLDDCGYSLTDNPGYLRISVPGDNHSLWPIGNYNAPRVTRPVAGDFVIETRMLMDPQYHAQQAGLLVWSDTGNFLQLMRGYQNEGQMVVYGAVVDNMTSADYDLIALNPTCLRIVRVGDTFSYYYGSDGISWTLLGSTVMAVSDPVQVGLCVHDQWNDNPVYADFDFFRFNQHAVTASTGGGGGGAVSPDTQVVTRGTSAVVSLTPDTGCYVASVTDNATVVTPTPTDSYVIPSVTDNHEVVVTFSPFSDEFSADPLNPGWTWTDPLDDCGYSLTDHADHLRISVPGDGHDLYSGANFDAPRITQSVGGDFVIETRVLFDPRYASQNAGVLVWKDSNNFVRLDRRFDGAQDILFWAVDDGVRTDYAIPFTGTTTFLRLARAGDSFSAYYSGDGIAWTSTGSSLTMAAADPVEAGLYVVVQWNGNPIYADFDYFRYLVEIDADASPAEGGTVDGSGYYYAGDAVNLEATPAAGYDFINWTEGGLEVSRDSAYSFTAAEGRSLVAHFARKTYAVMVDLDPGTEDSGTVTGSSNWKDIQGLPYNQTALAWDGTGLYVGTYGQGVHRYDPATSLWSPVGMAGSRILSLAWDGTGLYAGTEGSGVWYYNPGPGMWTDTAGPVGGYNITSLAWDGTGLYAGTYGQGVYRYDPGAPGWTDTGIGASEEYVSSLAWDGTGLYAGSSGTGVWRYDPGSSAWTDTGTAPEADYVSSLLWAGGGLYAGMSYEGKVWRYGAGTGTWSDMGGHYSDYPVSSLACDDNYLYTGTWDDGVRRYDRSGSTWEDIGGYHNTRSLALDGNTLYAGTNGGNLKSRTVFTHGDTVDLEASPGTGWHFFNWTEEGVGEVSTDTSYSFTATADRGLTAHFAIDTFTLSTGQVGSGSVAKNPGQATYDYGTEVQLTAIPSAGWHFVEWSGDLAGSTNPATLTMDANKTAIAHFALNTYSIAASADPASGGTVSGGSIWTDTGGGLSSYYVASLAWDGSGLYAGTLDYGVWRYDPVAESWSNTNGAIQGYDVHSLAWDGTGLYAGTDHGAWYYDGSTWTLTGDGGLSGYNAYCLAWDGSGLYAGTDGHGIWRYDPATESWADTGGGVSALDVDCLAWDGSGLYAGTADGLWRYDPGAGTWADTGGAADGYQVLDLAWDGASIYAGFYGKPGVWRYDPGAGTWTDTGGALSGYMCWSVTWDGTGLYAGMWDFDVWRYDPLAGTWSETGGDVVSDRVYDMVLADAHLYAGTSGFGVRRYNTFDHGDTVDLTATPADHYDFVNWTEGGTEVPGAGASYSFTATSNRTLTANFVLETHTLATGQVGSGSVAKNPSQTAYDYGSSVELTATPATGWHFWEWSGDLTGSTNPATITMDADKSVTAHFNINQYTINVTAGAGGSISPSVHAIVDYGSDQTFTITPNTGYHVVDVKADGVSQGALASYTFTNVTANHIISATFALNTYTITATAGEGGFITPSGNVTVNHGASQSFTLTPFEGWSIADVVVDGVSRGAVTTINFSGVTADHTINASFKEDISPLATWYLAEGSTDWGFDCYISVINPNEEAVEVQMTYMTSTGPVSGPRVAMPPMSQATVFPRETLGAADFSTRVTSTGGKAISVDRTMYWTGTGSTVPEAHCATGVTSSAGTWYMPEGSSNWGFECFVLIQNPGGVPAEATVTWMIEGEDPQTTAVTIPASSRSTLNMAEKIGAKDASIKVESASPIICERAMYRNDRREGHDSGGTPTAALDYYLAEGCTGFGFTTYVLVQNPNDTETEVAVTYQAVAGPVQGPSFTMPPNSRKTINVNATTAIPEPDPSFSTRVHGSQPIIAERAMYWNGGEDAGEVCHDSIGLSAPHRTWYLADGQTSEGRETWTLVQNPNASDVTVRVTYLTPDGAGNVVREEVIPAFSRVSFDMASHSGINGRAAIMVDSITGNQVMCERAMYWNMRGTGTDTVGGYAD